MIATGTFPNPFDRPQYNTRQDINLRSVENFTKGWRKGSAISTDRLPALGSVVIRERRGTLLLIRVLAVTAAIDSNYAGFTGVYCDRDGKPVNVRGPRFYGSRKLAEGGFFKARQNHKRPMHALK
jgi:hypothetical protein